MKMKFIFFLLFILLIQLSINYQFRQPNYDILKKRNIINFQNQINFNIQQFLKVNNNQQEINNKEQLNEVINKHSIQLVFQMFIYPYRLYSYIDELNKKQYIFNKIIYHQFQQNQFQSQTQNYSNLFDLQFNVKQCLFSNLNKNKQCFQQHNLYQLLPQYLVIEQQPEQQIKLQKINEEYFLIKSTNMLKNQQKFNYLQILDLYMIDFHSYIFEARKKLLKKIYDKLQAKKEFLKINNQKDYDQFKSLNYYQVKVKDYFNDKHQIINYLNYPNQTILNYLFQFQSTINIQQNTLYSYIASNKTFYYVELKKKYCNLQNSKNLYSIFQSFSKKSQNNIQNCTYLKIYKKQFIQSENILPNQFIKKNQVLQDLKSLNLWLNDQQNLVITFSTKKIDFMIQLSHCGMKVISETIKQEPHSIIFIDSRKILFYQKRVQITAYINGSNLKFQNSCIIPLQSFLLYGKKINNDLFVICVEGSLCSIYNKNCFKITEIIFDNAFGIDWNYKINYIGKQIISYAEASKKSQNILAILKAPLDLSKFYKIPIKYGNYLQQLIIHQTKQFNYKITSKILQSTINSKFQFNKNINSNEIIFKEKQNEVKYVRPKLFNDIIYLQAQKFRINHLDYILKDHLLKYIQHYYFPKYLQYLDANLKQEDKSINLSNQIDILFQNNQCVYNEESHIIEFQKDWNFCKVIIKSHSALKLQLIDAFYQINKLKEKQLNNQNLVNNKDISQSRNNIYVNQQTRSNIYDTQKVMIVCKMHYNSEPSKKCHIFDYQLSKNYQQIYKQSQLIYQKLQYLQIYFINKKQFASQKTFSEILYDFKQKYIENKYNSMYFQVNHNKVNFTDTLHKNILFKDLQKQQLQNISKLLFLSYCIFFPTLTIILCVICLKNYFFNILIYYGIINVKPNFKYPLSEVALKIKLKQMKRKNIIKFYQKNNYQMKNNHKQKYKFENDNQISINSCKIQIQDQNQKDCCFCLQIIQNKDQLIQIYCQHIFHKKCFIDWIKVEPNCKCPLCKRQFTRKAYKLFNFKNKNKNSEIFKKDENVINGQFQYDQSQSQNGLTILQN